MKSFSSDFDILCRPDPDAIKGLCDGEEVVETYVNEANELVHLTIGGEEIVATPTHPFYSPVKGWTAAGQLRVGDILVMLNGEYVVVEQVQHELLETPIKVYNFQVEDYHTYYVGNTEVLVHNSCGDFKKYDADKLSDMLGKDFHRDVKPKILAQARKDLSRAQLKQLGNNPDILLRTSDGAVKLASRISKSVSYLLTKSIYQIMEG